MILHLYNFGDWKQVPEVMSTLGGIGLSPLLASCMTRIPTDLDFFTSVIGNAALFSR